MKNNPETDPGEHCGFENIIAGNFDSNEARRLVRSFLAAGSSEMLEDIPVAEIEGGSSNRTYRTHGLEGGDLVFRVPKPVPDSPRTERGSRLLRERDVIESLPPGTASISLWVDESKTILPFPYAVEAYIPGIDGSKADWSDDLLKTLGRKIGTVHRRGRSPQVSDLKESVRIDILHEFGLRVNDSVASLRAEDSRARVTALLGEALPYFQKNQALFDSLGYPSLVHNDLLPSNIRVSDSDVYIRDWEWSGFGDGAHDLSQFYDTKAASLGGEWRTLLESQKEDALLEAYLSAFGPDPTLRQRVYFWQQFEKVAVALYIMGELDNPGMTHMKRLPKETLRAECEALLNTVDFSSDI